MHGWRNLLTLLLVFGLVGCDPAPRGDILLAEASPLRTSPSANAPIIEVLPAGLPVALLKESGDWRYVCYRGQRGWINLAGGAAEELTAAQPLENSLLRLASTDSVAVEVSVDSEAPRFIKLGELSPWIPADSTQYAGFYEGLPGEEVSLIIVNFIPRIALLVKVTRLEPETMDLREEQTPLGPELRREQNLLTAVDEAPPFQQAEFIRWGSRTGILLKKPSGEYAILWRRAL